MPLDGLQLGHYRLLRPIGSGGMGEVYLAEDSHIHRQVAIKVIRSEVSPYPNSTAAREAARLFQREARAIASLDHPNILPLYDYGEEDVNGAMLTYLVTPFRQEGSLATWLQRRNEADRLLTQQDVAHIVAQAASALQYAHDHGVVHQDVKPSNFLIRANPTNPERPDMLLADFGIAKLSSATSSASQSIRGTPAYMAPEQWAGEAVPATDQYALAVMAYELLVGRPPFQGSPMRMMYLHANEPPPPPSTFNARLSPDIDSVLLHALAKKPAARFASIAAFARAFEQAAFGSADISTIGGTASGPDSADIRATLAVSPEEARQGTSRTLTLPGGRRISVHVPAGIQSGQILRLEGANASSDASSAGALLLTISITDVEEESNTVRSDQPDQPTSSITRTPTIRTNSDTRANSQVPTLRTNWHEVQPPANPAVTPFFGQGGPLAGNTLPPATRATAGQPALTQAQDQLVLQSAPPLYAPAPVPGYSSTNAPSPLTPYQNSAIAEPRRRSNTGVKILLMLLVLLLIGGSVGAFFYLRGAGPGTGNGGGGTATAQAGTAIANTDATNTTTTGLNNGVTATTQANNTATAQANAANATATANANNANVNATAQANASATAQAQANAQATTTAYNAMINTANTTSANPYPSGSGSLRIDDPLVDNSQGYNWCQATGAGNQNSFNNGLRLSDSGAGGPSYVPCGATTTGFSDFTFQVQMKILKGSGGGIIFRADSNFSNYYYFLVGPDGSYGLYTSGPTKPDAQLTSGHSSALLNGYNTPILVAVVVHGSTISLYVNLQQVATVTDSTYTQGTIGVFAYDSGHPSNDADPPSQVVFNHARVWA